MMKKYISLLLILILAAFYACAPKDPSQPTLENVTYGQLVLSKYVSLGNSLTAGFQSGGMREDFQAYSFPRLIAKQVGLESSFEQPTVAAPGIGSTSGRTPLYLDNEGNITSDALAVDPLTLLTNAYLSRPYDNLGVPGAKAYDLLNATSSTTVQSGTNPFFDMILRNPNLGNTTQLQQAILLQPTIITLWIGNNDLLGSMMAGTDQLTTDVTDFQTYYTTIVTAIGENTNAGLVLASLPYVTDIPYCNTGDLVFATSPMLGITEPVPVVFDASFQPVDFGDGLHIPLVTEETSVEHLILSGITAYQSGLGVPDSAWLYDNYFFPMGEVIGGGQAHLIEQGMIDAGLNPTGMPLTGEYTLTQTETDNLNATVDAYNAIIEGIATEGGIPWVDANAILNDLNTTGVSGFIGKFLPVAAAMGMPTAFSLDGIHLSNGGAAIVANAFIEKINMATGSEIPLIDPSGAEFTGQYAGTKKATLTQKEIKQIERIFGLK